MVTSKRQIPDRIVWKRCLQCFGNHFFVCYNDRYISPQLESLSLNNLIAILLQMRTHLERILCIQLSGETMWFHVVTFIFTTEKSMPINSFRIKISRPGISLVLLANAILSDHWTVTAGSSSAPSERFPLYKPFAMTVHNSSKDSWISK